MTHETFAAMAARLNDRLLRAKLAVKRTCEAACVDVDLEALFQLALRRSRSLPLEYSRVLRELSWHVATTGELPEWARADQEPTDGDPLLDLENDSW